MKKMIFGKKFWGGLFSNSQVIFKYIHAINILGEILNGKSLVTEQTRSL